MALAILSYPCSAQCQDSPLTWNAARGPNTEGSDLGKACTTGERKDCLDQSGDSVGAGEEVVKVVQVEQMKEEEKEM